MYEAQPGARPLLVELDFQVQTYDIDFAHHVNNCVYIRWLEDLRIEMLRRYYPLERVVADGTAGIVHSTHIVYKRSIQFLDKPRGIMWCSKVGKATMTLEAEIRVGGALCAHATQRVINLRRGGAKPVRWPDDLAETWRRMNGEAAGD